MGWFWESDEEKLARTVREFPAKFEQAKGTWVKFVFGVERDLFTPEEHRRIADWFEKFPEAWETIKINWTDPEFGGGTPEKLDFAKKVDRFVEHITGSMPQSQGLGIVISGTIAVIAGIGLLVGGGAATVGALWFLGYLNEEAEAVASVTDAKTQGLISDEQYEEALKALQGGGLFGDLESVVKTLGTGIAVTVGLLLFWPQLKPAMEDMFKK